jgi:asparaginyl-tRNA synthetase
MISTIKRSIKNDDKKFAPMNRNSFRQPIYNPKQYCKQIVKSNYFYALLILRHHIKVATDYYFGVKLKAKNIDLFMLTPSVSSPAGPGSNSKAIPIKFGKFKTFLVDSSQFGFEPLLLNKFDKVYCYLPSMRGEKSDSRHLNQFYHCEMEMIGSLDSLIPKIEGYIKELSEMILLMPNIINRISENPQKTKEILGKIIKINNFPSISFDEAVEILIKNGHKKLIKFKKHGKDISHKGEIELMKILDINTPFWLKHFDRDRVAFYQKPKDNDATKTINADLLFPPLIPKSFGGEIVGSGQRQDNVSEMYKSLKRQKISPKPYKWYIDLRKIPGYKTTSGFGMGIERFIAWFLAKDDIKNVILYPRIRDIRTYP